MAAGVRGSSGKGARSNPPTGGQTGWALNSRGSRSLPLSYASMSSSSSPACSSQHDGQAGGGAQGFRVPGPRSGPLHLGRGGLRGLCPQSVLAPGSLGLNWAVADVCPRFPLLPWSSQQVDSRVSGSPGAGRASLSLLPASSVACPGQKQLPRSGSGSGSDSAPALRARPHPRLTQQPRNPSRGPTGLSTPSPCHLPPNAPPEATPPPLSPAQGHASSERGSTCHAHSESPPTAPPPRPPGPELCSSGSTRQSPGWKTTVGGAYANLTVLRSRAGNPPD
ncbi:WAS/WASL-interacting protein family member 3-like [Vombatus ursinus]|uniref:WAS/WASL-interacting protein family member 3-like n=1 Tax=Vombatus ursinus TaxID=29139 RepID=UPI000FFD69AE|nr:WAS/WASL-interacting protein family member 3-like [Vombatus ursinus]